jgi:hypothetical protein
MLENKIIKRLTIENFESIIGKETRNLKIEDAGWDSFNDKYFFLFRVKGVEGNGEVIIKREPSIGSRNKFYLEIRWKTRNNPIYMEEVSYDVFKQKTAMFRKLDEIVMERLKLK